MTEPLWQAIRQARTALEENADCRWILGFSGGKDSTALLKVMNAAIAEAKTAPATIDVIYCDTGVENPVLDRYVKTLFKNLETEFRGKRSPFRTVILKAPVKDRFFVKIIGRGYPPPTNSFRWCTKNLRIRPVSNYIREVAVVGNSIVALGMRRGESQQRDRTLVRSGGDVWQKQIEGGRRYRLFLPILDMDVYEVWDAVFGLNHPTSINAEELALLYRGASGECPVIRAPNAPPCASGRFGCWTCTVVRKDRSSRALIEAGYLDLIPYVEFRDWLGMIRNDASRRWPLRRSGKMGPGPFNLATRGEILARVDSLEQRVGTALIVTEEREAIRALWFADKEMDCQAMQSRSLLQQGANGCDPASPRA